MTRASVVLIRHGLSALPEASGFIDRLEILAWQDAMDAVGIASDAHPPAALVKLGATFDHVIASAMPRAIESAERLFPGRDVEVSPLFREAPSEFPTWLPLRWPLGVWKFATGSQWIYRIARWLDTTPRPPELRQLERVGIHRGCREVVGFGATSSCVMLSATLMSS